VLHWLVMSMLSDDTRVYIQCDGENCQEQTEAPVALRAGLDPKKTPAYGWLFVHGSGVTKHYCPNCSAAHISDHGRLPGPK